MSFSVTDIQEHWRKLGKVQECFSTEADSVTHLGYFHIHNIKSFSAKFFYKFNVELYIGTLEQEFTGVSGDSLSLAMPV